MATLKKSMIIALSSFPDIEGFEKNHLILTTAAGTIHGKLISDNQLNDKDDVCGLLAHACEKIANNYIEENSSQESALSGNDGYLFLTDVRIRSVSSSTITTLPFMIVFFDQIIGITIGSDN